MSIDRLGSSPGGISPLANNGAADKGKGSKQLASSRADQEDEAIKGKVEDLDQANQGSAEGNAISAREAEKEQAATNESLAAAAESKGQFSRTV